LSITQAPARRCTVVRCDSGDCHHHPPKYAAVVVSSRSAFGAEPWPKSRPLTRANAIRFSCNTAPAQRPNSVHTRSNVPKLPHGVEELKFIFCIQKKFFQGAQMLPSEFIKTLQTNNN
jgi:hypothetical protein